MTDSQIQRASAGACCRTTPHEAAQCHRCPLKEASGYPLASPYILCLASPPHNSSACAKHIHRTSARTQTLPSVINDHTRRVGVQAPRAPVPILLLVLPGQHAQHALYRMGNGERPHRCPPPPTASASTRARIAPLPHASSVPRKWRIRQRKAVDGGEVVDWKDRCRKAPRAASGENVEVSL
jgi:hypothetical protein